MLIYLDANIVQYCADEEDFIFGNSERCKTADPNLRKELVALRRLVELEQLGDWHFVASPHLMAELHAGKPTRDQRKVYKVFQEAWNDSVYSEDSPPTEEKMRGIEQSLSMLKLKHAPDQRHLAEAIALNASWFLTNDKDVVKKAKGGVGGIRVSPPSECLRDISTGLSLR